MKNSFYMYSCLLLSFSVTALGLADPTPGPTLVPTPNIIPPAPAIHPSPLDSYITLVPLTICLILIGVIWAYCKAKFKEK